MGKNICKNCLDEAHGPHLVMESWEKIKVGIRIILILLLGLDPEDTFSQNLAKLEKQKDSLTLDLSLEKRVQILNNISFQYWLLDQDSSLHYAHNAIEFSRQNKLEDGLFWAIHNLTHYYFFKGEIDSAFKFGLQGIEIAEEELKPDYCSIVYNDVGAIEFEIGNYKKSQEFFLKGLEIQETGQNKHITARLTRNLGRVFEKLGQVENAKKNYLTAFWLSKKIRDTIQCIEAKNNMGMLFNSLGEYDSASFHFEAALDLLNSYSESNTVLNAELLTNIAQNLLHQKNYEKSEKILLGIISHLKEKNFHSMEGKAYALLSQIYFEQKRYDKAVEFGKSGYEVSLSAHSFKTAIESSEYIHKAFRALGQIDSAYSYLSVRNALKDSIVSKKKNRKLNKLIENYNLAQKDLELAYQKQLIEAISKKSKFLKALLVFLVLLAIALSWLGIRLNRSRKFLEQKRNEIEEKNLDTQKLNDFKDRILSIMAHDIRGPLSNLSALMDMLMEGSLSEVERRLMAAKIKKQLGEVFSIFDNLLLWSKSQLVEKHLTNPSFNLSQKISDYLATVRDKFDEKGINLHSDIERELVVLADKGMVETILRNLLSNSLKFTNKGGEVIVSAKKVDKMVVVQVADNGIGMSKEEVDKLFELNENSSRPGTEDEKGTGLGLPLTREFVNLSGGNIWVESEVEKGSKFYFSLPST